MTALTRGFRLCRLQNISSSTYRLSAAVPAKGTKRSLGIYHQHSTFTPAGIEVTIAEGQGCCSQAYFRQNHIDMSKWSPTKKLQNTKDNL